MAVREAPAMMVFSERAEKIKLEGGVEVTCDCKPFDNAEYRKLLMRRHKKAAMKTSAIKRMPGTTQQQVTQMFPRVILPDRKSVQRYAPKHKRARMDRESLENFLFGLFDKKKYYNINELIDLTDQPKAFLKDVLGHICFHHKTGVHIHHFSLKPKYSTS